MVLLNFYVMFNGRYTKIYVYRQNYYQICHQLLYSWVTKLVNNNNNNNNNNINLHKVLLSAGRIERQCQMQLHNNVLV